MNHFEKANEGISSLCSVYEKRISDLENKLRDLIKIIEIVNWDFDGGMVEITEQEYRLIKDAIRAAREI